jgi:methanol---5-hydroxybenzimidazolylcobamide Co-methyltransferase
MKFKNLSISDPNQFIFGICPKPVITPRGLKLGGGLVYPELNFTLPTISISRETLPQIVEIYKEIVNETLKRAIDLDSNGLVLEFETLLEMTMDPFIGTELVKVINDICEDYYCRYGLISEIRLTPNDLREFERPPKQRTSGLLERMLEMFEKGLDSGGDMLSIESTGGKEISDNAILNCDTRSVIFALSVLGVRDMDMLWTKIVDLCTKKGKIPGGDTACGFANTAMVLAERKMIPKIFAAMVRIASIVRSLVAIEKGATGPHKDCGYEGIYIKAITGIPISMEGKTAACAHFSQIGNVAAATADLWSNESVQYVKLLSGIAPVVYFEQLEYDTRLMNEALKEGHASAKALQRLLVNSDIYHDPQALILSPENAITISNEIVKADNYIEATVKSCLKGIEIIEAARDSKLLKWDSGEDIYLEMIKADLQTIPYDEGKFIDEMMPLLDSSKVSLSEYGI